MKHILTILTALLLAPLAALPLCAATEPEVWFGPPHAAPRALVEPGARWPTVQQNLDTLQFAINAVAFLIPQDDLKQLAALLQRNRIRISVECGYFDWEPTQTDFDAPNPKPITDRVHKAVTRGIGRRTARVELAKIKPLLDAGGVPDYLVLDGPVRRMIHPGADTGRIPPHGVAEGLATADEAIEEMIEYMREWRARFPEIRFLPLTNFPNWGWKGGPAYWASGPDAMYWGDYHPVIQKILTQTRAANMPVAGIVIDNPFEYTMGVMPVGPPWPKPAKDPKETDWLARLLDLERTIRAHGVDVSLIVNSQTGGHESDEAFRRETLRYLETYRQAGGQARRYVFQSWYKHPERMEPEDDPNTMTGMLREALRVVKGNRKPTALR